MSTLTPAEVQHRIDAYSMLVDALRDLVDFMGEPTSNAGEMEILNARLALARADLGVVGK